MCIRYKCHCCHALSTDYCPFSDWDQVNPVCLEQSGDQNIHSESRKCDICNVVEGAIHALNALVFRQPWLVTEGQSGSENRPSWELENKHEKSAYMIDWGCPDKQEIIMRLEAMGLSELDGKEELNDGHGIAPAILSTNSDTGMKMPHDTDTEGTVNTWGSDAKSGDTPMRLGDCHA